MVAVVSPRPFGPPRKREPRPQRVWVGTEREFAFLVRVFERHGFGYGFPKLEPPDRDVLVLQVVFAANLLHVHVFGEKEVPHQIGHDVDREFGGGGGGGSGQRAPRDEPPESTKVKNSAVAVAQKRQQMLLQDEEVTTTNDARAW